MVDEAYILAGGLTGFAVGLTGVGGGALMTPILLLIFGVAPNTAVATDLWFAAITKIVGAKIHQNSGDTIDWQIAKLLWLGSLPTSLLVSVLMSFGSSTYKIGWLSGAIGILVLVTAIGIFFAPWLLKLTERRSNHTNLNRIQPTLTILAGGILGFCVALTSVGAGALGSIILLYLYPIRMSPHRLVATDIVHAIPLAIISGMVYLISGLVNWQLLINLLIGSIPSVIAGSLIARKFSSRLIQIALAIILMIIGIKTLRNLV